MELSELRIPLDKLDEEIIGLVAKRMKLIPGVAEYKKKNNMERYQPKREEEIIKTRRAVAEKFGMNPDLAEGIMKEIINDAHRIEKDIMSE
jgi:chorismate mutase/prephenate dehydrogenase